MRRLRLAWLDPVVARRPFEGRAARRYVADERPAFGDLDDRLIDRLAGELSGARRFLDVGAGTGALAARIAARWPALTCLAVEPSATFTGGGRGGRVHTVRARAEALPLASGSIDVALCLSSLRHARDRGAALAELRRVVRGAAWIVELDPEADPASTGRHRRGMRSLLSRLAFDLLILPSGPSAAEVAAAARAAGLVPGAVERDPLQPVFLLRLT
jgi:SAM-dependent methyltransferase